LRGGRREEKREGEVKGTEEEDRGGEEKGKD